MPRIQHVSLEVDADLIAREVAFWEAVGFVPIRTPEAIGESSIWMQAGDQQVHLLPMADPVIPGSGHPALVADDFDRAVEALREAGFEVVPGTRYWGSPRARATAPTGDRIELMESPPT